MSDNTQTNNDATEAPVRSAASDFIWQRNARKRASTRTFEVQTDAKGRAILSFYVYQAPRPEPVVEEETA